MISRKILCVMSACVLGCLTLTPVFADEAPVVAATAVNDSNQQPLFAADSVDNSGVTQQQVTADDANQVQDKPANDLATQVQMLQQQVQSLQGQLEVQAHQFTLEQSQQSAQYQDLNRRINLLAQGKRSEATQSMVTASAATEASSASPNTAALASNNPAPVAIDANPEAAPPKIAANNAASATVVATTSTVSAAASEQDTYQKAYKLLGKQQYSAARNGFQTYLKQYPNGTYAGDSHYWLGELALVSGDNATALHEFTTVTGQFPKSSRVPAAMFRLGGIYAATGKNTQAEQTYNALIRQFPSSEEATEAKQQLGQLA